MDWLLHLHYKVIPTTSIRRRGKSAPRFITIKGSCGGWRAYNITMQFTGEELAAVMKLGIAMVGADGRTDESELEVVRNELTRFGASVGQMLALSRDAQRMEFDKAVRIISNFDYERKKYVASYLAVIMIADGEIDDKEVALWQLATLMCGLPEMDVNQAVDNMNNL